MHTWVKTCFKSHFTARGITVHEGYHPSRGKSSFTRGSIVHEGEELSFTLWCNHWDWIYDPLFLFSKFLSKVLVNNHLLVTTLNDYSKNELHAIISLKSKVLQNFVFLLLAISATALLAVGKSSEQECSNYFCK